MLPLRPQFMQMGRLAEGYSGSDIAVVVREALMEPLRKCQVAKQFVTDHGTVRILPMYVCMHACMCILCVCPLWGRL
jgi:hypothetical protein